MKNVSLGNDFKRRSMFQKFHAWLQQGQVIPLGSCCRNNRGAGPLMAYKSIKKKNSLRIGVVGGYSITGQCPPGLPLAIRRKFFSV